MSRHLTTLLAAFICAAFIAPISAEDKKEAKVEEGFIPLFDGKTLEGWKAAETPDAFKVEDGAIVVKGKRGHLFYVGPVENHNFKDFELKLEVMTFQKANAGVYFHTEFQESGWPAKGYECQVNATHSDWRKSGSLYAVQDVRDPGHKDGEWWNYHIIVKDKTITLKINDKTTVEYTEKADEKRDPDKKGRWLSSGTFALQAHDPESKVLFRNIRVKPLK